MDKMLQFGDRLVRRQVADGGEVDTKRTNRTGWGQRRGRGLGLNRHHCGWRQRRMKVSESPDKVSREETKDSSRA